MSGRQFPLSVVAIALSSVCILTDITYLKTGRSWHVRYFPQPPARVPSSDSLLFSASPAWGSGRVLASTPTRISAPPRSGTRRRRGAGCFAAGGVPHIAPDGTGIDALQCHAGDRPALSARCPSGVSCRGARSDVCAASGGCDLQQWAPCRHAPRCFSLPPAWPVNAPDMCPEACLPGYFHVSSLDPCTAPGLVLGKPQCRQECPERPAAPLDAYFRIECPPKIARSGLPCTVIPVFGYTCTPSHAGCNTDTRNVRCWPWQCRTNRSLTEADLSCPAGRNPSLSPRRSCTGSGVQKRICKKNMTKTYTISSMYRDNYIIVPPRPPPPPPSCCPSGNGRASVWNARRCVCVLAHLGAVLREDTCCDLPEIRDIRAYSPWKNRTISRNTQPVPCRDLGSDQCTAKLCTDLDGCYGFTRDSLLVSNGSWVPGAVRGCRLTVRMSNYLSSM